MYSYEERMRPVKLFIQYDHSFASIKRELSYPNSRVTLNAWFAEYQKNNTLHQNFIKTEKYSAEQRQHAINHYYEHGRCISRTIRSLGYPSRTLLKQ